MNIKIGRTTALASALAIAAGGLLAFAGPASATEPPASSTPLIGSTQLPASANGKLLFSVAAGAETDPVTWSTSTSIGASAQSAALFTETSSGIQEISNAISASQANSQLSFGSPIATQPVSEWSSPGSLVDSILGAASGADNAKVSSTGATFEVWVASGDANSNYTPVFDAFVTIFPDYGFQISAANPVSGRAAATVTVGSLAPVNSGSTASLTATISSGASGTLVFYADGTALGAGTPVAAGVVTPQTVTTGAAPLGAGSHNITAVFTPNGSSTVGSGSDTVGSALVVNAVAGTYGENVTVTVKPEEGQFTYTVGTGAVSLLATTGANGHVGAFGSGTFNYSANMNPVTVTDLRVQSAPGWHVDGAVTDFAGSGTAANHTIPGYDLGWVPAVTTQDPASDVTAGPAIAPQTNPGLSGVFTGVDPNDGTGGTSAPGGGKLALAGVGKGLQTTVLGGALNLKVPDSTKDGVYNATLTFTAITTAAP